MDDCYFIDPGCSLESAERTSTQVTRRANRKKRLTVLYIVEHPNQEGDTCIDWTSQYCWTNGWNCLWRGHSVYRNRPLIPPRQMLKVLSFVAGPLRLMVYCLGTYQTPSRCAATIHTLSSGGARYGRGYVPTIHGFPCVAKVQRKHTIAQTLPPRIFTRLLKLAYVCSSGGRGGISLSDRPIECSMSLHLHVHGWCLVPVQCAVLERVQYPCVYPPVSLAPLPVAVPCPRERTVPCLFKTRNDLCKLDDIPAPCHAVFGGGHIMSHLWMYNRCGVPIHVPCGRFWGFSIL